MSALNKFVSTPIHQTEKSSDLQVENNAGGHSFTVSDMKRFERFLILGTDGGTYYVTERAITKQNVDFVVKMVKKDARAVLNTAIDVSQNGRAYRNEMAIFVMAVLLNEAPADFKATVVEAVPQVVRTATHAYELAEFVKKIGGWGPAKRKAIVKWFQSKTADQLAYQAVKYRSRTVGDTKWTLRDLMRLSHPTSVDENVGNFILGKPYLFSENVIAGYSILSKAQTKAMVLQTLEDYPMMPWETIPTEFLKDAEVWKTLFANGQLNGQALVRNITRLTKIGAFNDMVFTRMVANRLVDSDMIVKSRLHPIQYLLASVIHREGQVQRDANSYYGYADYRSRSWDIVPAIADALDEGFHKAFKAVEPAGKRTMLALDVSGSMAAKAIGIELSCAQVSAAMAMVTARTEPYTIIRGFASEESGFTRWNSTGMKDLGITPKQDFGTVMRRVYDSNFGGTDCGLPMTWALKNKVEVDTFCVYTDSETYAGKIHPHKALEQYRQKMGIDAKLVVVGVAATDFTIADPNDPMRQLDVAGFDSNTPRVIADFSAGRL